MAFRRDHWATLIVFLFAGLVLMVPGAAGSSAPLVVTPDPVDYGKVTLGETKRVKVTVRNTTLSLLTIDDVRAEPSAFSVAVDGCDGKQLFLNGSCDVEVEFGAGSTGTFTGSISFVTAETAASATLRAVVEPVNLPTTTTTTVPVTTIQPPPPSSIPPGPTTTRPTGTVPVTTSTTLPQSGKERVEECERRAQDAEVSFVPVREMVVGETSQVAVTASVEDGGALPATTVTVGIPTTVVPARLNCVVQARLRGLEFTIEPGDFEEKSFLDAPVITWSWDVKPERRGRATLTVELRSVARIDGEEYLGGPKPFYAKIEVTAKPEGVGDKVTRWTGSLVEHPLVSGFGSLVLIVGTMAGGWRWLLKRPWPWTRA